MAPKVCFLGAVRRRTMICCHNAKISASIIARDRNRSTTAQTMSLTRSLITEQHRPILGQPPVNRFATGTRAACCGSAASGASVDRQRTPCRSRDRPCPHLAGRLCAVGCRVLTVGEVLSLCFVPCEYHRPSALRVNRRFLPLGEPDEGHGSWKLLDLPLGAAQGSPAELQLSCDP